MQTTIKNNRKRPQNRTTDGAFGNIPRLEEITTRAHELYLARGAQAGHELDDWLQAGREIMECV